VAILFLALGPVSVEVCSPASGQQPANDSQHIGDLIKQLGSDKFQERAAAQKELEAIGVPALGQLKKIIQSSDLETSRRIAELVERPQPSRTSGLALEGGGAIIVRGYDALPISRPQWIVLTPGPRQKVQTNLSGSVRLRLFESPRGKPEDYRLLLEVTPEPR